MRALREMPTQFIWSLWRNNTKLEFKTIPTCCHCFQTALVNPLSQFQYSNWSGLQVWSLLATKHVTQIWLFLHLSHSHLVSQSVLFLLSSCLKEGKNVKNEGIFQNMLMNVKFLRFLLPSLVSFSSGFVVSLTLLYKELLKAFLSLLLLPEVDHPTCMFYDLCPFPASLQFNLCYVPSAFRSFPHPQHSQCWRNPEDSTLAPFC